MDGRGTSHLSHPNRHMFRITRDEADLQSIVKLLEDDWTNPLDSNESEFVSISTGTLAPPDVARAIIDAHTIGMAAYEEFKRDRLGDERPKAQFYAKIMKLLQANQTTSFYKLTGICLPTWSLWQRSAISG